MKKKKKEVSNEDGAGQSAEEGKEKTSKTTRGIRLR